jgi:hypothetical protein
MTHLDPTVSPAVCPTPLTCQSVGKTSDHLARDSLPQKPRFCRQRTAESNMVTIHIFAIDSRVKQYKNF